MSTNERSSAPTPGATLLTEDLMTTGLLREAQVLQLFPFSRATLWRCVKREAFPKPVKLSRGINVWRVQDLRLLLDKLGEPTPP